VRVWGVHEGRGGGRGVDVVRGGFLFPMARSLTKPLG
jgi:hypothetical protein